MGAKVTVPVVTTREVTLQVVKVEERRRERWGKSRVYVWPQDESVLENLVNRRSRPHAAYRQLLDAHAATLERGHALCGEMRWSQKAGCACGCSPGFVLERAGWVDYHVTVKVTVS